LGVWCLAALIPLTMFFYAAMRYMTDFIAPLSLLAVLGLWETGQIFRKPGFAGGLVWRVGASLAAYSILAGPLLAFSVQTNTFAANNLELINQVRNWFR
jgi:hypothetical protein